MRETNETKEKKETGKAGTRENKPEFRSSYTRGQRIAAVIGVAFLVALYLVTLVAAITTSTAAPELFRMCIGSTILLPILFWFYIRIGGYFMNRDRENIKKQSEKQSGNEE